MRRCEHGNYIPAWQESNLAPYCTGCYTSPPPPDIEETKKLEAAWESLLQNTEL